LWRPLHTSLTCSSLRSVHGIQFQFLNLYSTNYNDCADVQCQVKYQNILGGTVCREFELDVPAAEEMLDHVVCSREQFSFHMCLESGDGSGTFRNRRQRVPDSWCRDTECLGLEVDPCRQLIE